MPSTYSAINITSLGMEKVKWIDRVSMLFYLLTEGKVEKSYVLMLNRSST
jgi:hypothetical protein